MSRDDSYSVAYPYRAEPVYGLDPSRDTTLADTGVDRFYRALTLYDRLMFFLADIKRMLRDMGLIPDAHDEYATLRYGVNPVGNIPILGQLVGIGFEIGKTIRGDTDVVIIDQYGTLPILKETGEVAGMLVKYWPITLALAAALGVTYVIVQVAPVLNLFQK